MRLSNNDEKSRFKRHAGSKISRAFIPLFMVFLIVLAILPAQSQDVSEGSGRSTYIVVFNDAPGLSAAASSNAVANLVSSYGGDVKYRYNIINGMAVTMPDSEADKLSSLPNVKYVEKDGLAKVQLDQAVPQIGADQAWATGYNGSGVRVAIIDTGVDASHPDLNNRKVVAWADFVNGQNSTPYDDHGHGTHVSSILAGTGSASGGQYTGVAPGASLIVAKVINSSGVGTDSDVIRGIEWAVANHAQVISLSLGGDHKQFMDDMINNTISQGVIVVAAAGNNGPISCPGDNPNVIAVGAVYKNDTIAEFSSRGPAFGNVKPDVTAPGVGIMAARANGNPSDGYYKYMSGTSMATPMVSGVVALMLQKNSSLTPAQVKNILEQTAKPLGGGRPNNDYGWGRVQAKYAVDNVTAPGKYPRTVWSDLGKTGPVTGEVTALVNGTTIGIGGAYVAVVNASNTSQEYYNMTADMHGNYLIADVNATYSSVLGEGPDGTGASYEMGRNMYRIYAYKSPYGENWSAPFGIDANGSAAVTASVTIPLKPARIELKSSKPYVAANGTDSILITAYVYDVLGYPVADGYYVNFSVGNATNNSFTNGSFPWVIGNGSLGSRGNNVSLDHQTMMGRISVRFGWVDEAYSGNNSTIWAYIADNPRVNSSIKVYFDQQSFTFNLTKGWNMISLPLFLENESVDSFFPATVKANLTDMWYYNNGAWVYYSGTRGYSPKYAHLTNITPGKGYWVKLSNNSTFTVYGVNEVNGVSAAGSGWTMFGVEGFGSLNATLTYPGNKDMWYYENGQWYYYSSTRGYSPKYPHLENLDPGKGYWVHY